MLIPSNRIQDLPPYFFAVLDRKITAMGAAGHDIIRLDVGSPDLPPDPAIVASLSASAAQPDNHGYQSYNGTAGLRSAWAAMYQRVFEVTLNPDTEVLNLLGSKEGIFNLLQATINPGDIVLCPDPGYPTYHRGTILAGGKPYYLPLLPGLGFTPDFTAIPAQVLQQAKVLWLNYPNNPTGATADLEFFTQAVEFAHQHNLLLCHDAAYTQVTFDGYTPVSVLQVPGAKGIALEFNSLSKSHNMPGWRVGAAMGNRQVLQTLLTYKTNVDSGHFRPILEAATTALTGDQQWLQERNQVYQYRRDILVDGLQSLGFELKKPKAALYLWCCVPDGSSSLEFATRLLDETHLSLTPGTVFGSHGEGYLRISLAAPTNRIIQAVERLKSWRNGF
jgi:LL-diaminopimelate aminotransferase